MNRRSGIYQIRNTINGKVYIGSAVNIKARWQVHWSSLTKGTHHSSTLQRAWLKHGPTIFAFEILQLVPDKADLLMVEQEYLDRIKPFREQGYNISPTAASSLGIKRSAETVAKISASKKGGKLSDEHRAKIAATNKARMLTSEGNAAMRTANEIRWSIPDAAAKQSTAMKGFRHTPEAKAKISAGLTGKKQTPETLAKLSAIRKGRKHSAEVIARRKIRLSDPEIRARISATQKRVMADPATRSRIAAANRNAFTPERRANIAAAAKARYQREKNKIDIPVDSARTIVIIPYSSRTLTTFKGESNMATERPSIANLRDLLFQLRGACDTLAVECKSEGKASPEVLSEIGSIFGRAWDQDDKLTKIAKLIGDQT